MGFCLRFLLFFIIVSSAFADAIPLQDLLNLDRFHVYLDRWSKEKVKQGQLSLSRAIKSLSADEIQRMNIPPAKLSDVSQYDELILRILTEKHPGLRATSESVRWDSPKIKARLQASYRIEFEEGHTALPEGNSSSNARISNPNEDPLLFDGERYTSDRLGRAPLWDASQRGQRVELHLNDVDGFRRNISERGGEVIARVRGGPHKFSEPLFVVNFPGEEGYHYAIAEVQGADRVRHFEIQSSRTHWGNSPPSRVEVVGDIAKDLKREEALLTTRLMALPPADKVVIGYIDTVRESFELQERSVALKELLKKSPDSLTALATDEDRVLLARFESATPMTSAELLENKKLINALTIRATALFELSRIPPPQSVVIGEHKTRTGRFVDLRVKANGEEKVWRVFSNVWGDQILPIAKALRMNGVRDVTYIGTAGAVDSSHQLGDLVVPETAVTTNGLTPFHNSSLPDGAKRISTVGFVPSPLVETRDWKASNPAPVVEVETRYLAEVFNRPGDRVRPFLVISDIIGKEGSSISDVGIGVRTNGRNLAMGHLIDEALGSETIPVGRCKTPRCQCLIRSFNALIAP